MLCVFFFFNDTATTEIYTLSLHDALPICPLEAQQLGVFHHQIVQPLAYLAGISLQYLPCLAHILLIFLVTLLVNAGSAAVVDVIFQAWFVFSGRYSLLCDGLAAGAWLVQTLDQLQHGVHAGYVGVGPEVGAIALVDGSGLENTGEILVRHANAGVGFAILQQYVVAWVVLFDETVLKQ